MTKTKARTVTTDAGTKYKLVAREEAGLVDCPGDAHSNPYIDNCGLCAPRWGTLMSYKVVTLSALTKGIAVPVSATHARHVLRDENSALFESAERTGKIKMVMVTEKTRSVTTSFFAYVLA